MLMSEIAEYLERIENTRSKLEMTDILSELFKKCKSNEIAKLVYILQGRIKPPFTGIYLGIGEKYIIDAIALASGYPKKQVGQYYKKSGDIGKTAEHFIASKKQSSLSYEKLSLIHAHESLLKITEISGAGSQKIKIKKLAELFMKTSPLGARYLARFANGKLRLGVGDPTILDALSVYLAGSKSKRKSIERAYNLCSDLGYVAELVVKDPSKIDKFKLRIFSPIRPALAERLPNANAIFAKLGPCYVDSKYDGMRMMIHRKGDRVEIYSRRLDRITDMFPDVVRNALKLKAKEFIIDGEALAYNEKEHRYFSFQETMQRKRKYGIKEEAEKLPLNVFAFDLLYKNGRDYIDKPFRVRRKELERLIDKNNEGIKISAITFANSAKEIQDYFDECISQHLEGIIAKDPNAPYVTGARKFSWIKLKKSYAGEIQDTFDVAILGYYRGKGSRARFDFGGVLCGVYNPKRDMFETITKVGSGFTEEQMREFSKMLSKIRVKEKPNNVDSNMTPDYWVEPKYVITVAADNITLSPNHTCGIKENKQGKGYALRFPRMIMLRPLKDKDAYDSTTTKEIVEMYNLSRSQAKDIKSK